MVHAPRILRIFRRKTQPPNQAKSPAKSQATSPVIISTVVNKETKNLIENRKQIWIEKI